MRRIVDPYTDRIVSAKSDRELGGILFRGEKSYHRLGSRESAQGSV